MSVVTETPNFTQEPEDISYHQLATAEGEATAVFKVWDRQSKVPGAENAYQLLVAPDFNSHTLDPRQYKRFTDLAMIRLFALAGDFFPEFFLSVQGHLRQAVVDNRPAYGLFTDFAPLPQPNERWKGQPWYDSALDGGYNRSINELFSQLSRPKVPLYRWRRCGWIEDRQVAFKTKDGTRLSLLPTKVDRLMMGYGIKEPDKGNSMTEQYLVALPRMINGL